MEDKRVRTIRLIRAYYGYSMREMANLLGVHFSLISKIEGYSRNISDKVWESIQEKFPTDLVQTLDKIDGVISVLRGEE